MCSQRLWSPATCGRISALQEQETPTCARRPGLHEAWVWAQRPPASGVGLSARDASGLGCRTHARASICSMSKQGHIQPVWGEMHFGQLSGVLYAKQQVDQRTPPFSRSPSGLSWEKPRAPGSVQPQHLCIRGPEPHPSTSQRQGAPADTLPLTAGGSACFPRKPPPRKPIPTSPPDPHPSLGTFSSTGQHGPCVCPSVCPSISLTHKSPNCFLKPPTSAPLPEKRPRYPGPSPQALEETQSRVQGTEALRGEACRVGTGGGSSRGQHGTPLAAGRRGPAGSEGATGTFEPTVTHPGCRHACGVGSVFV